MKLAPASGERLPKGVKVVGTAGGPVYADAKGRTLYGLDMRTVLRAGPDPAHYCASGCEQWEPLLAPRIARVNVEYPRGRDIRPGFFEPQKAPDWTVIQAAAGPQWVYKGWHLVFTRKVDKPGLATFDGADSLTWNTLKYVPPVPAIVAPPGIAPLLTGGGYALATEDGRLLYSGACADACSGWTPLAAGAASSGVGEWRVDVEGDTPQWTFRKARVFVAATDDPLALPPGAKVLRP